MQWSEKKHKWAVDFDGRLLGYPDCIDRSGTRLFSTRNEARIAARNRRSTQVSSPRVVKVEVYYIEIINE